MTRELAVTSEEVCLAAESLFNSGEKPTTRNIRDKLGRGSISTILKYLQKWQSEQDQVIKSVEGIIDPTLALAINKHTSQIVKKAADEAAIRLSDMKSETELLIHENEKMSDKLFAKNAEFKMFVEGYWELFGGKKEIEAEVIRINAELKVEREVAESARTELTKCEIRLQTALKSLSELENVRADLQLAKDQAARLHEVAAVQTAKLEAEINLRSHIESQLLKQCAQTI